MRLVPIVWDLHLITELSKQLLNEHIFIHISKDLFLLAIRSPNGDRATGDRKWLRKVSNVKWLRKVIYVSFTNLRKTFNANWDHAQIISDFFSV